jgi:RNA polymerase sigma-70 factor, ECF subfamily
MSDVVASRGQVVDAIPLQGSFIRGSVEPDERDVVRAACEGDHAAWEELYRRLYPRIRAYLTRRVGVAQADDAVSETMARVVSGIHRFRWGPAGFDGWVFGIARHVAADHHRKAIRHRRQDTAAMGAMLTFDGSGEAPGDGVVTADDHTQLRRAFAQLNEAERELLELRIVAGLSAEQVAAVLHKAPGAVRTAQSRALGRLRRMLEADRGCA